MNLATPELRNRSIQLLANGTEGQEAVCFTSAAQFCSRLSTVLAKLTGPAGSRSLLSRALVLAREEAPCLVIVQVMPDGRLHGFEESASGNDQDEWNKAGIFLVAQLLGLLHAFIGQRLSVQLVDEAWPIKPKKTPELPNEPDP